MKYFHEAYFYMEKNIKQLCDITVNYITFYIFWTLKTKTCRVLDKAFRNLGLLGLLLWYKPNFCVKSVNNSQRKYLKDQMGIKGFP